MPLCVGKLSRRKLVDERRPMDTEYLSDEFRVAVVFAGFARAAAGTESDAHAGKPTDGQRKPAHRLFVYSFPHRAYGAAAGPRGATIQAATFAANRCSATTERCAQAHAADSD